MEEIGLERCKTCGKEYTTNQVMTYSVYGFCSWDCLMNKKPYQHNNHNNRDRDGRRDTRQRNGGWRRSRYA